MVRKAHLLLNGAYWGYKAHKVLTGGSVPKTTLRVLQLERRSAKKEKREAELTEANARKSADLSRKNTKKTSKKRKPASASRSDHKETASSESGEKDPQKCAGDPIRRGFALLGGLCYKRR